MRRLYADAGRAWGFLAMVNLDVSRLKPKIRENRSNIAPMPIPAPCSKPWACAALVADALGFGRSLIIENL